MRFVLPIYFMFVVSLLIAIFSVPAAAAIFITFCLFATFGGKNA